LFIFCLDDVETKNKKIDANTKKLKGTLKKKKTEGYDLILEPSSDTNWCEPRGVWHNENLSQGTDTIGMSRMMPQSQLIFDKSHSVHSRTKECKNHSHTLKLKNSEVIIIKGCWNFRYVSLNSYWKINPNGPLM
jgi:hypothetical protein